MVKSMTGFGRSTKHLNDLTITVEIKTVNHRFYEQTVRMPKQLLWIEDTIKKTISSHIHRGRAEVFITIDGDAYSQRKWMVDWDLLDDYYQIIEKMKKRYSIEASISIQDLLKKEESFQLVNEEKDSEEVVNTLILAVEEAVKQLNKMRITEGTELKKDFVFLLKQMETSIEKLQILAPFVISTYRDKLKARIESYIEGMVDEARLMSEVAIFADKADINEEIIRLNSHKQQFAEILEQTVPIGRKLDFLLQEMNREVNTIGSKANSAEIAKEVVELKSFLEKMKEQVQNLE